MKKIKCPCGWFGNKYEVLVSISGFRCPVCEKIIADEKVLSKKELSIVPKPPKSGGLKQE